MDFSFLRDGPIPLLVIPILGAVAALIGGLTLTEYLFHVDLRIDQLLFHAYINTQTLFRGRMSPVSSVCISFAGTGLVLLGLRTGPSHGPLAIGSLASVIISISLVALTGYALGLPGDNGWAEFTRDSVYSAAVYFFLGVSLFTIAWSTGLRHDEHTPRWLPIPLVLSVCTGSFVLYSALENKQQDDIIQTVRADAEGARNQVSIRMDSRSRSLSRMARDWQIFGVPTQAEWQANAASYVRDIPDVQALQWVDSARHLRWIAESDGSPSKDADVPADLPRTTAMDQADREQEPVITRIVTLADGDRGFIIYAPITLNGVPDGYLVGVFKANTCLARYLPAAIAPGEAISVDEGRPDFFDRDTGAKPGRPSWAVIERVKLRGATWNMRVWPTPALAARLDSPLPKVVPLAGVLGGLLLGAVSFFAQRSSRQAAETGRSNAALRAAIDTVKTLEGLLPICCYCKRVRDDSGYWSQIDTYLRKHTKAALSHSYCPECAGKFYEECGIDVPDHVKAEIEAHNYE
jgi:sensor domain CHASE-containing protein